VQSGKWQKSQLIFIESERITTINSADLLNWQSDVGSISKGKFSDMVAVSTDPLKGIAVLESVDFVMRGDKQ
jgi:imidazolonepropionase-like amidohydrolase